MTAKIRIEISVIGSNSCKDTLVLRVKLLMVASKSKYPVRAFKISPK